MPKARFKNLTIYYEIVGKGFPVLLIAGLGSDHSSWLGVAQALSKRFQVILFDNRGCGRSECPDKKYSIRQMADDAKNLLDYLNIQRCHIIGHSMGGYIAQAFAIHYPERAQRLILEATAAVSSRRNRALFDDFLCRLEKDNDLEMWFRQWAYWLFSPASFNRGAFVRTFVNAVLKYPYLQSAVGFKRQIEAIASFNVFAEIKAIKAKTLVLVGSDDILIYPKESEVLAKNISSSVMLVLENTAHCIHLESPEAFINAVTNFLPSPKHQE